MIPLRNQRAYYNENDPFAAQWLRNLIKADHLPAGDVDDRSIHDVHFDDLKGHLGCHFFAGIGVWAHAIRCAGYDGASIWTGSCPCQPFSVAGKGKAKNDERHLWPVWRDLIAERRPAIVFGEQVASPSGRDWFADLRTEMEALGYGVGGADLCAAGVGAPHIRQRLYFGAVRVAESDSGQCDRRAVPSQRDDCDGAAAKRNESDGGFACGGAVGGKCYGAADNFWRDADWLKCLDGRWRAVEPGSFPLAHGVAGRVGRLRAYGNAIVAPLAATFVSEFISAAMEVRP